MDEPISNPGRGRTAKYALNVMGLCNTSQLRALNARTEGHCAAVLRVERAGITNGLCFHFRYKRCHISGISASQGYADWVTLLHKRSGI
ncbi:hypothetical protein NDU88_005912 [Pleurodeles waltl]|uniref:Uncharacterized protein n=1 Tax=Pleurodeles waltl TaxID=8319 RepID=A0AAV7TCM8_PLEWA|nr:hypothetical protein NDU88_005912 [Pleurodeles waltl]